MRSGIAALAAAIALGACSSSGGPQPTELTDIPQARNVRVLWSAQVGHGEEYYFEPALNGDAVYAAGRAGTVARFDAATGPVLRRSTARTRRASSRTLKGLAM